MNAHARNDQWQRRSSRDPDTPIQKVQFSFKGTAIESTNTISSGSLLPTSISSEYKDASLVVFTHGMQGISLNLCLATTSASKCREREEASGTLHCYWIQLQYQLCTQSKHNTTYRIVCTTGRKFTTSYVVERLKEECLWFVDDASHNTRKADETVEWMDCRTGTMMDTKIHMKN